MSIFSRLAQEAQDAVASVRSEITKYKSKDFLDAVMAATALVGMADGEITPDEKQKMMAFLASDEDLSVFNPDEMIASYKGFVDALEMDVDIGGLKAMKAIGKVRGKEDAARILVRLAKLIGSADGDFDDNEKAVVKNICMELGLDPAEFEV